MPARTSRRSCSALAPSCSRRVPAGPRSAGARGLCAAAPGARAASRPALGGRKVFVRDDPSREVDLATVVQSSLFRDRDGRQIMAQAHFDAPCDLPDPETGVGDFAMSYSFGAHAVEVEVDEETGLVRV